MLRDLPASNNLFSLLETVEPDVTSDRFYGGGLNIGRTARVGAFLNSWTQTQYRVGDVNITAPDGSGSPFLFPTLPLWSRVDVSTAVMPAGFSAPGLGVARAAAAHAPRGRVWWTRRCGLGARREAVRGSARGRHRDVDDWRHVDFWAAARW